MSHLFKKYKRVHCIGIGGIHVSALAKLLLRQGVEVGGSDLIKSEITQELVKMGIRVYIGHDEARLRKECETTKIGKRIDLVIYSDAVPKDNIERVGAKRLRIKQMSSYEFIGELSKNYYTIAVSGTNGKSTTTAMLGLILEFTELDPTVIVGTKVNEWEGNIRIGKSKYLVAEADEYKAHMLKLHPKMIVLTNIEEDHLDFYQDLNDIIEHFKKYIRKLPKDGILVYNKDNCCIAKLLNHWGGKKIGYSVDDVGHLKLQVPGEFNLYNAAGAACAAKELGIRDGAIKKALENFKGTWRRFETVGEAKGALVISDYAHHPTSVAGTIKATKDLYPARRLIAVFQPHQHNRTRMLFNGFARALSEAPADLLILSEIYGVAGRTSGEDKKASSKKLVKEIEKLRKLKNSEIKKVILYSKDLEETKKLILNNIGENDVVLIMGAGNIDKVARNLVS